MSNRTIYVPNDRIWQVAKDKAAAEGKSLSQVIDKLLRRYIVGEPVTREQRMARAISKLVEAGIPVETAVLVVFKLTDEH